MTGLRIRILQLFKTDSYVRSVRASTSLTPHSQDNIISFGNTAIIERVSEETVVKSPHPQASSHVKAWQRRQLQREFDVYRRLPAHDRLIKMFGFSEDGGLLLEYMPKGSLRAYLESNTDIPISQRLQWGVQAGEAVVLLHSHGIIHADIKPENMLLDKHLGLRIIDLSGSSIDGLPPLSLESARFYLPRSMQDEMPCSVTSDLFALGSSIYQIVTRRQPFDSLKDEDVEARYARKEFPPIDEIPYGDIIRQCWMCEFDSAQAVLDGLIEERRSLQQESLLR